MLEHQRATDQMLQGLVLPSATEWRRGAERLLTAPLEPRELAAAAAASGNRRPAAFINAERAVHAIAARAVRASDVPSRASAYVELVTTCAACHGAHATAWGPRR
jgi:cytochrome c553